MAQVKAIPKVTTQSGSYLAGDVTLLLDIVDRHSINNVAVEQKEALIQTGARHYSDMLTFEQPPSVVHDSMYKQALRQSSGRMAQDISKLSVTLHNIFKTKVSQHNPLILVSLVRAGLPIGVLLQRALSDNHSPYVLPSCHYGMSIIRDRGLDPVALQYILDTHPNSPLVFVDGWTGKGAIYTELVRSLNQFTQPSCKQFIDNDLANVFHQGTGIIPLLTLADPAGVAWLSASQDDWLIPSGLLGSTVSGLISRTLFSTPSADLTRGLHKSIIYDDMLDYDHSLAFVSTIDTARQQQYLEESPYKTANNMSNLACLPTYKTPRYTTASIINTLAETYNISNRNRIKPTIAEATRAIMRRDPQRVLLATADHPDTALLRHLCQQRKIAIDVVGATIHPYQAVTIIKKRY